MSTAQRDTGLILQRGEELDSAEMALRAAFNGEGSVLLIEGPAGMGKTRLSEAIIERSERFGFVVHQARGDELEAGFAFGILRQLLQSILGRRLKSERASILAGPGRVVGRLVESSETSPGSDPLGISYGFYRVLVDVAERQPVLIHVDDTHSCDIGSLQALTFAARRIEDQPLIIIAACRPTLDGERADLIRRLSLMRVSHHLRPSPFELEAVAELTRRFLGSEPDESFVRDLHHATGGNPFLLTEVLAAAQREGPQGSGSLDFQSRVPDRVTESVQQRIIGCGSAAVRLAEGVAILGEGSIRDTAHLAGLDVTEAGAAADRLAEAHILSVGGKLRFTHPIVREAVASRIPPVRRGLAHADAGRILADAGAPLEEVVAHLLRAPAQGDEWIVDRLLTAAKRERSSGSPETAEPLLARALDEPPPDGERFAIVHELAAVRAQIGHPDTIETARREMDLASDLHQRATAQLQMIRAIGLYRGFGSALNLLGEVNKSKDAVDPDLALRLEAELLGLARLDGENYRFAVDRLEELAPRATPVRPASVLLLSNLALSALERNDDPSRIAELAELALSQGWLIEEGSLQLLYAVTSLIWIDDLDAATRACHRIEQAASETGAVSLSSMIHGLRSMLNLRRGSVADAVADARVCWDLAFPLGAAEGMPFTRAHLADALMERAQWAEADRALAEPAPEERADLNPYYLHSRGRSSLAHHDPAAALQNFTACGTALARRGGVDTPTVFPWRSLAARAHMLLGDEDKARELAEEELELAEKGQIPGAIGEAMTTLGMIEDGPRGQQLILDALKVLDESPRTLVRIRALTELGAMIRRSGNPKNARRHLKSALDLAHRHGAIAREQRAHEELVLAGARPRRSALTGVDALTPSERRVAQLVGKGLANREIADALFVSPRTVSTHLTHIYQKLTANDRAELESFAAEQLG
jgi:DNA-binding CsgD family transcriptional regulator